MKTAFTTKAKGVILQFQRGLVGPQGEKIPRPFIWQSSTIVMKSPNARLRAIQSTALSLPKPCFSRFDLQKYAPAVEQKFCVTQIANSIGLESPFG